MDGKMTASLTLIYANQKSYREESSASSEDDKKKDKQAAQILLLRAQKTFWTRSAKMKWTTFYVKAMANH